MAEVMVSLESALTMQEKSTHYSLPEIIPDDFTQENVEFSNLEVNYANRNDELFLGKGNVNVSNDLHCNKQSAGISFQKRVGVFISFKTQVFSGNRYAKRSRYSNIVLSVNSNNLEATDGRTFIPEHPLVPPTPRRREENPKSPKFKIFTFNDLIVATRKFHPDSLLGEGGFGCVYRGWIDENTFAASEFGTGMVIAVTKLNLEGLQGHNEWLAEINYLDTFCHPNLVKLIGYCFEEEHQLLVYEFMSQGSLDKLLFKRDSNFNPLSWKLRMSIALGAAKGLAYLHSSEARVIHRDIKPSNILIDSNYNAKLTDFGLAADGPDAERSHVTTRIMGTYGYAAPEYIATGHLYMESDVYSFGVVLLEILTGRRAHDMNLPLTEQNLVHWAKPYLTSKHKIWHVMDAHIKGQCTVRTALRASLLALECISEDHKLRPNANQVVKALEMLQEI